MGKGDTQSNSRQLLPNVLKARAQQNPGGAWAQFPISEHTYADGLGTATNRQVFNAVNKVAWFLQKNLGPASNFETIAYLGPFDPRYFIVVIAGIKVGYKTFLPSPRNSKAAQLNLLSRLECTKIVTVDPQPLAVSAVLEENPFTVIQIPSLQELLSDDENNIPPEYPFEKSYEDAKDEPIFVLHTSGSTGFPKPLTYTHRFVTRTVNLTSLPAPEGFSSGNDTIRTGHWFTFLAPFHISGIGFGLMVSAYNDCVPVYPLPSQPLSTAQFLDAVKHVKMDWAFVLPFILEDLSKDPAALDLVSQKLKHLYFAGGSVPKAAGDVVSSKLPLYQTTGSSEVSLLSQVHSLKDGSVNKDKWMYINIHPALNIEYRHHHGDLYEMVIVRNKEDEELQPVFLHFPKLQEYETRDLLTPHPTLPGLWRYRARKDDIIVFLNGEKTNPISFEQEVARHAEVRSAMVAGAQRFEACLIVEPHKNETLLSPEERAELLNRIWGNIEKANQECPAHARVSRENVIFTHPSKPFPRAAKGTVQRAAALLLYEEEIEKLYAEREAEDASTSKLVLSEVDLTDSQAVSKAIENLVSEITQWNGSFSTDTDFFSLGMDSLQVIRLSRQLNLPPSTIYMNPSVDMLTKAVTSPTCASQDSEVVASALDQYERAIDKIAADIAQLKHQHSPETVKIDEDAVVVLTGSTGAVGSYVLQKLLQNNKVAHVYCLNRVPDSQALQRFRNTQRRIQCDLPSDRVSFLKANLAEEKFGLDDAELYIKIQSTATHFIHNAWPVNFNQSLLSFRPSLDGVLGLVHFAAHATCLVSIVFLSSVSTITNYSQTASAETELVPEEIITDPKCPAGMGYGQSKYVSERILDYASKTLNLPNVRVARVGQIAGTSTTEQGPPHGWNRHEWLPSLVISSHYLKAIPESLGSKANADDAGMLDRIDWVPIDQLAALLVEIAFNINVNIEQNHASQSYGAQVFHPTNPRFVSWQSLLPAVVDALTENSPSASTVKVLKYGDWLSLLRSTASSNTTTKEEEANERVKSDSSTIHDDALTRNPAVKLLEFFESLAFPTEKAKPLAFEHTAKTCPSLQSLDAIKPEWLRGWIKDWVLGSSDE